jgi:hypothetical protein
MHNSVLDAEYTEKEIKEAVVWVICQMVFYQEFWDVIKKYLIMMFYDWHRGKLDIFRLNFSL